MANTELKQGLAYISDRGSQFRYANEEGKEQWVAPMSRYKALCPIKRGQAVSVATFEDIRDASYTCIPDDNKENKYEENREFNEEYYNSLITDPEPYVTLTNTLRHEKCVGLAMETVKAGQELHIMGIGKFDFDTRYENLDGIQEYNPHFTYKMVGKKVFIKYPNPDGTGCGLLTTDSEESYKYNHNVIQLGYLADAPVEDVKEVDDEGTVIGEGQFITSIEINVQGDQRGPIDNTQFEVTLGEDLIINELDPIRFLALGQDDDKKFEAFINLTPQGNVSEITDKDFIAIQKLDGKTAYIYFKDDGGEQFNVNSPDNLEDKAFISQAQSFMEINGYKKDFKNGCILLRKFNDSQDKDSVIKNMNLLKDAFAKAFNFICDKGEYTTSGNFLSEDGVMINAEENNTSCLLEFSKAKVAENPDDYYGSFLMTSKEFGGYFNLYVSSGLKKRFDNTFTVEMGSSENKGKAVLADIRIPSRRNVIGVYYGGKFTDAEMNAGNPNPLVKGFTTIAMRMGQVKIPINCKQAGGFENGCAYYLGYNGRCVKNPYNQYDFVNKLAYVKDDDKLIVDVGKSNRHYNGDLPVGYMKPAVEVNGSFGYDYGFVLMDGQTVLEKAYPYDALYTRLLGWFSSKDVEVDENTFKVPKVVRPLPDLVNGGNKDVPMQIKYLADGIYEEMPFIPFFRSFGKFDLDHEKQEDEEDFSPVKCIVKDIDITDIVEYGIKENSYPVPDIDCLDIRLFVDPRADYESGPNDWREIPSGFYNYNNTSTYGYRWFIERDKDATLANPYGRFTLKMDIGDSEGVAYVTDKNQSPLKVNGCNYKVYISRKDTIPQQFDIRDLWKNHISNSVYSGDGEIVMDKAVSGKAVIDAIQNYLSSSAQVSTVSETEEESVEEDIIYPDIYDKNNKVPDIAIPNVGQVVKHHKLTIDGKDYDENYNNKDEKHGKIHGLIFGKGGNVDASSLEGLLAEQNSESVQAKAFIPYKYKEDGKWNFDNEGIDVYLTKDSSDHLMEITREEHVYNYDNNNDTVLLAKDITVPAELNTHDINSIRKRFFQKGDLSPRMWIDYNLVDNSIVIRGNKRGVESPTDLTVGNVSSSSLSKYKRIHGEAIRDLSLLERSLAEGSVKYESDETNKFKNILGSALQAAYELPLAYWQYNTEEEWYKDTIGVIVERVNDVAKNISSSLERNILDAPTEYVDGELARNTFKYTDQEIESIREYLKSVIDNSSKGQNITSSVGMLFKAAKETQERLLKLEASTFGRDYEQIPGGMDKFDVKGMPGVVPEPTTFGLNRLIRAICLELYSSSDPFDPTTLLNGDNTKTSLSRIDRLDREISGIANGIDDNTKTAENNVMSLDSSTYPYPDVINSEEGVALRHKPFFDDEDNTVKEKGVEVSTREKMTDENSPSTTTDDKFNGIADALYRITAKVNALTESINNSDNIMDTPVRLNTIRQNIEHIIREAYFEDKDSFIAELHNYLVSDENRDDPRTYSENAFGTKFVESVDFSMDKATNYHDVYGEENAPYKKDYSRIDKLTEGLFNYILPTNINGKTIEQEFGGLTKVEVIDDCNSIEKEYFYTGRLFNGKPLLLEQSPKKTNNYLLTIHKPESLAEYDFANVIDVIIDAMGSDVYRKNTAKPEGYVQGAINKTLRQNESFSVRLNNIEKALDKITQKISRQKSFEEETDIQNNLTLGNVQGGSEQKVYSIDRYLDFLNEYLGYYQTTSDSYFNPKDEHNENLIHNWLKLGVNENVSAEYALNKKIYMHSGLSNLLSRLQKEEANSALYDAILGIDFDSKVGTTVDNPFNPDYEKDEMSVTASSSYTLTDDIKDLLKTIYGYDISDDNELSTGYIHRSLAEKLPTGKDDDTFVAFQYEDKSIQARNIIDLIVKEMYYLPKPIIKDDGNIENIQTSSNHKDVVDSRIATNYDFDSGEYVWDLPSTQNAINNERRHEFFNDIGEFTDTALTKKNGGHHRLSRFEVIENEIRNLRKLLGLSDINPNTRDAMDLEYDCDLKYVGSKHSRAHEYEGDSTYFYGYSPDEDLTGDVEDKTTNILKSLLNTDRAIRRIRSELGYTDEASEYVTNSKLAYSLFDSGYEYNLAMDTYYDPTSYKLKKQPKLEEDGWHKIYDRISTLEQQMTYLDQWADSIKNLDNNSTEDNQTVGKGNIYDILNYLGGYQWTSSKCVLTGKNLQFNGAFTSLDKKDLRIEENGIDSYLNISSADNGELTAHHIALKEIFNTIGIDEHDGKDYVNNSKVVREGAVKIDDTPITIQDTLWARINATELKGSILQNIASLTDAERYLLNNWKMEGIKNFPVSVSKETNGLAFISVTGNKSDVFTINSPIPEDTENGLSFEFNFDNNQIDVKKNGSYLYSVDVPTVSMTVSIDGMDDLSEIHMKIGENEKPLEMVNKYWVVKVPYMAQFSLVDVSELGDPETSSGVIANDEGLFLNPVKDATITYKRFFISMNYSSNSYLVKDGSPEHLGKNGRFEFYAYRGTHIELDEYKINGQPTDWKVQKVKKSIFGNDSYEYDDIIPNETFVDSLGTVLQDNTLIVASNISILPGKANEDVYMISAYINNSDTLLYRGFVAKDHNQEYADFNTGSMPTLGIDDFYWADMEHNPIDNPDRQIVQNTVFFLVKTNIIITRLFHTNGGSIDTDKLELYESFTTGGKTFFETYRIRVPLADMLMDLPYMECKREGYRFKGWASSPKATTTIPMEEFNFALQNYTDLYAIMEPVKAIVKLEGIYKSDYVFKVDGLKDGDKTIISDDAYMITGIGEEDGNEPLYVIYENSETVHIEQGGFVNNIDGYTFAGWEVSEPISSGEGNIPVLHTNKSKERIKFDFSEATDDVTYTFTASVVEKETLLNRTYKVSFENRKEADISYKPRDVRADGTITFSIEESERPGETYSLVLEKGDVDFNEMTELDSRRS